jgi:hypothetical protein
VIRESVSSSAEVYAGTRFWYRWVVATGEHSSNIPLAEVFRAANELVAASLIENWALGGALAAIYYVDPFTTYDANIFFIPADKGQTAGIPAIYAHLQRHGWQGADGIGGVTSR